MIDGAPNLYIGGSPYPWVEFLVLLTVIFFVTALYYAKYYEIEEIEEQDTESTDTARSVGK